jgi:anaerobic selenocysteine-containing dehydrogenase
MRHVPELRELAPEPVAEIHPDTVSQYGVKDSDMILVETKKGQIKVKVKTTVDIMPGVVNVLHGWAAELNQNVLTDVEAQDPVTGYPELRALACRIRKS